MFGSFSISNDLNHKCWLCYSLHLHYTFSRRQVNICVAMASKSCIQVSYSYFDHAYLCNSAFLLIKKQNLVVIE